jgi:hypothetical protein
MPTFFDNTATPEIEDRLNEWRNSIVCDCPNHNSDVVEMAKRKRILENFEIEPRLSINIRNDFVKCLVGEFNGNCQDALQAIQRSQEKSILLMLNGPKIGTLPNELCLVRPAKALIAHNIGEPPIDQIQGNIFQNPRGKLAEELLIDNIKEGYIGPRHLQGTIRGQYPFVWATFAENVNEILSRGESADKIRDMLGLDNKSCEKGSYLVGLFYKRSSVESNFTNDKGYHFPTVIEGGDNPAFRPAPDGETTGLTMNLQDGGKGFPEAVHPPIENPSQHVQRMDVLGDKLTTDPPKGYLNNYIS